MKKIIFPIRIGCALAASVFALTACGGQGAVESAVGERSGAVSEGSVSSAGGVSAVGEDASAVPESISDLDGKASDATHFHNANSSNYYVIYNGEKDASGKIKIEEGILQFGRDKELKNCISMPEIAAPTAMIERVTDQAIYITCPESEDLDASEFLYKIPLEKTEGDDKVLVEKAEKLVTLSDPILEGEILYIDDDRVVYDGYEGDEEGQVLAYRCMQYSMETGETAPLPFLCSDGVRLEGLENGIYIGDGVIASSSEMDSGDCDRFFYLDVDAGAMVEAVLPDMSYNIKTNYRIWGWASEESIFYYPCVSVGYPFGRGTYDLYRYDKKTGEADVFLSHKQLKEILESAGVWSQGMEPFVSDIMWTGTDLLFEVEIEKRDEDKEIRVYYAVLRGDETAGGKLSYEAELSQFGRGKGDKKGFKSKYGEIKDEDCELVFYQYPYVGYGSGGLKNEVFDLETRKWYTAKRDASDWYFWLSVDNGS